MSVFIFVCLARCRFTQFIGWRFSLQQQGPQLQLAWICPTVQNSMNLWALLQRDRTHSCSRLGKAASSDMAIGELWPCHAIADRPKQLWVEQLNAACAPLDGGYSSISQQTLTPCHPTQTSCFIQANKFYQETYWFPCLNGAEHTGDQATQAKAALSC